MTTPAGNPPTATFKAPGQAGENLKSAVNDETDSAGDDVMGANTAELVQVDTALESWRDAGFDLTTAIGEIVDNSIEAAATLVRIRTYPRGDKPKVIDSIAFSDDGIGIAEEVLAHVLSLGYSTRYGQRNGMGRFGVGLNLATLSHARRVDIYTHESKEVGVRHAWLDLDDISDGTQKHIVAERLDRFPEEYADLMLDTKGAPQESGTLVVWNKVDRLRSGGRFQTDLAQQLKAVQSFLARAYRKFLDQGVRIDLNGREIALHDPTFQLDNPRVLEKLGKPVRGEVVSRDVISLDGHDVTVTVAVVPDDLIQPKGQGGSQIAQDLNIPNNEGRISFLRQGREINYDQVARMFPSGVEWGDRYIGIEVEFPAALDEYFQVRHVKRGVVPVDKLRTQLTNTLKRPIAAARKRYRARWEVLETDKRNAEDVHAPAADAAATAEQTAPRGKAGTDLTQEQQKERVDKVVTDLTTDLAESGDEGAEQAAEEVAAKLRESVDQLPITMVDRTWPGKELLDITHLNGKAIVELNHGHPFVREVYDAARTFAALGSDEVDPSEALRFARKVEIGLDLLFMAYAKAENMHRDPEMFADLRMYWGQSSAAYVNEAFKKL